MRRADTTFVNLRATLDDLTAARRRVQARGQEAAPLPGRAAPAGARRAPDAARPLARSSARPGADNDLIELTKSSVPLRNAAVGPTKRNGKQRDGALPGLGEGARGRPLPSSPPRGPTRPTSPAGSTTSATPGVYDALGGASRAAPHVNLFAPVNGVLKPLPTAAARAASSSSRLAWTSATLPGRDRARRDRGSRPPDFPCDASQVPLGPVRRALVILARRWSPSARSGSSLSGAGNERRQGQPYWVELDNAFGLIQRRRPEGRRRARGQDHRASSSTSAPSARWSASRSTRTGFGVAAHRHASASRARSR